jgi:hypothetical protein
VWEQTVAMDAKANFEGLVALGTQAVLSRRDAVFWLW